MLTLDDYQGFLRKLERIKKAHDQEEGAFREMSKRLRTDFGCKTSARADRKVKLLAAKERKYARLVAKIRKEMKRKWYKRAETLPPDWRKLIRDLFA